MQTEEETIARKPSESAYPCDVREPALEVPEDVKERLSPERLALLKRTLEVRRRIGRVSTNVAELVHEMRERGV